jgi:hypothetical protein
MERNPFFPQTYSFHPSNYHMPHMGRSAQSLRKWVDTLLKLEEEREKAKKKFFSPKNSQEMI